MKDWHRIREDDCRVLARMTAGFSERLRAEAGEAWTAVVEHPFTDALAQGTDMDEDAMRYYLIQDHRFLDDFVVLLASMVAAAPTLQDRIPGCQFLALITGKENTYFERSFEVRADPPLRACEGACARRRYSASPAVPSARLARCQSPSPRQPSSFTGGYLTWHIRRLSA